MSDVATSPDVAPETPAVPETPAPASNKKWYVIKVQSGREDTIKDAIERRVRIEGLEEFFGQIIVPVERTVELVKGKKVTRTKKLYPGYIMAEVEFNDRVLYLFRETSGVGDFVGGGGIKIPLPMPQAEVDKILNQKKEVVAEAPVAPKIDFHKGEHIKVKDGMFAGMEGEVSEVLEAKGLVRVMLKIFGRDVPVELEYWQIEHP
ncbi:MAG TPA: transcription termination/antitermination protein NusG [Gemmatales bacterium]|nr:transcription termination/antitermination protein NusG [Gemmatales bacterium]